MKDSKILKIISYIIIPILMLVLILSLFYNYYKSILERSIINQENYFETDDFLESFMINLSNEAEKLIYENSNYTSVNDNGFRICYSDKNDYRYNSNFNYYYLITYKNLALTNVELTVNTNSIQKIKDYITNLEGKKANFIKGEVSSDSKVISSKAIQYFDKFNNEYYSVINDEPELPESEETKESPLTAEHTDEIIVTPSQVYIGANDALVKTEVEKREYYSTTINDFDIYTTYKEELNENEFTSSYKQFVNFFSPFENISIIAIPICSTLLLMIFIYLIISIGHSKGKDDIDLNDIDKVPIEIIFAIDIIIVLIACAILSEITYFEYKNLINSVVITMYLVFYIVGITNFITLIKRIKAKTLLKSSIIVKICKYILNIIKKIIQEFKKVYNEIASNLNSNVKLFLGIVLYCILSFLMIIIFNGFGIFIDIIIFCYICYKIIKRENCSNEIKKHLKNMYEGKEVENLKISDFTPEFKDVVISINDIANGFENAKQEGIKSERMKTELITNVSHDIKTPLTSIINYVDLLKKEEINNKKAKEYIDILDSKSQRLKKLTEDLVEASKASSGNVKLNIEKIEIKELIKQTIGEFEDRFKEKKLDVICDMPKDNIYINADSKYIYRIIENLFSNISKYALKSSRVYIDVKINAEKVKITFKNISKEKLNITANELMQRFVRGDKSRTTEGSGLGLSISQSLTELQNGTFDLKIDGDLFKVEIEFFIVK